MKFNYQSLFKPIFDISLAFILLLLLFLFLFLVAILIRLDSKGPIFYTQDRLGKDGKVFKLLKFRSMVHRLNRKPGESGEIISGDHPEITNIGKFIRRFKIDELPQLINILKGDLSLVGPRPCLPELREQFNENGEFRLLVKPGCTGLAQIYGNIYLPWPERWKYDAYYVKNISFLLDLKIILKTLYLIFVGEDKFFLPFDDFIGRIEIKNHQLGKS